MPIKCGEGTYGKVFVSVDDLDDTRAGTMIAVKRSKRSDPCEGIETNVVREIYAPRRFPLSTHCSILRVETIRHDIVMRAADRDLHVSIEGGLAECAYKTCLAHRTRHCIRTRAASCMGPQAQERPCARRSCDHLMTLAR